ncbi:MerR family transcriptional regulator [Candidatus Neomarinimicrobiota bacterium]
MNTEKKYPIKVVSNRTGLSMHVIRAWEKRYSAIQPLRNDTNRRLYSAQDILKLQLLKKTVSLDYRIGTVANLTIEELEKLITDESNTSQNSVYENNKPQTKINPSKFVDLFIDKIYSLDSRDLNSVLREASIVMNNHDLLEKVIAPIITTIGDKWRSGRIRICHEHVATLVIRAFLINLRNANVSDVNAPGILICTPKGHVHELGALLIAALAVIEGWRVTYLGSDVPAEEVISVATTQNIKIVCVSIVYPYSDPKIVSELEILNQYLPNDTKLIIGGRAASSYKKTINESSALLITDLSEFKNQLQLMENDLTN